MGSSRERKHGKINFDFLQKLGKVLMTVIAVMPAAGLMISLGKLVQMAGADASFILTVGSTMENIGWAVINNLHILFAVAIGGSWAKERAGGAFAAVISFILINQITGSVFGVTADMLNDPAAVTHTLFGQEILVNGYFTSVLGDPALNMGVFVGIISGFAGGVIYNKYYNFRKLPDALAFFNGKRFVPMVCIAWSVDFSDSGSGMAGCSVRNQCFWSVDCHIFFHLSGSGPVCVRNPGTSASAFRTSSHADDSYELHLLWRNLHDCHRNQCGNPGIRTGSALAGMGNRFD